MNYKFYDGQMMVMEALIGDLASAVNAVNGSDWDEVGAIQREVKIMQKNLSDVVRAVNVITSYGYRIVK